MSRAMGAMDGIDERYLLPGFADPVLDSQLAFRALLAAMAYPGRMRETPRLAEPPVPFDSATAAVCLTLLDADTPVWVAPGARSAATTAFLRFHCGVAIVEEACDARFVVVTCARDMPRLETLAQGEDRYPDRSATAIVQVAAIGTGAPAVLRGPGIEHETRLEIQGLPRWFWESWAENHAGFPLGVDVILTCGQALVALPRSVAAEL